MIRLTIDGTEIVTEEGKTILEAARKGGIDIPTLCYHDQLTPIASCRLCIVEVEGYDKPMTSCTTPALEGLAVTTRSEKLLQMRRDTLNLILTAHPLDCPQCDKGGECRVQDLAYQHGIDSPPYSAVRNGRQEPYATPLIRYWGLRCVLCGRCVQGCREISGRAAIDIVGHGFEARISATDAHDCISCGECLSICPVGALTETLSPLKGRIWQSERVDTTCPHCGFGCRLTLNVIDRKIISKVVSETPLPPNHTSLCIRGRFGYDFANDEGRLTEPFQRHSGAGPEKLDRAEALRRTAETLQRLSAAGKGTGFIVSPRATNEEMFLIARIAERLPHSRIASAAAYHTGKAAAGFRKSGINPLSSYDRIAACQTIIVAGADLLINNHLLANQVRKAVRTCGARVIVIDPLPASLAGIADAHLRIAPGQDAAVFDTLSRRLLLEGAYDREAEALDGFAAWKQALTTGDDGERTTPENVDQRLFERAYALIRDQERIGLLFASGITHSDPGLAALLNFSLLKGLHKQGLIMAAALQANAWGAAAIFPGMVATDWPIQDPAISALFLYEDDPFHYLNGESVRSGLDRKEFIAVCDLLPSTVTDYAHLVLPAASFAEKEGTFLSGDGRTRAVSRACGTAAGFDFLSGLLDCLGGGRYESPAKIRGELERTGILATDGPSEVFAAGRGRFTLASAGEEAAPSASPAAPAPLESRKYRLILRDLFSDHRLFAPGSYGKGIGRVQKEQLFLSPEDAVLIGIADGENLLIESADGAVTRPVTLKPGIQLGVLECVLGETLRQDVPLRGEMLALSRRPSKVIAVSARKA